MKWLKLHRTILTGCLIVTMLLLVLVSREADGRRNREFKYSTPAPRFQQTESNYTYNKGERAVLYCSVKHLGTKTVSWRRANETAFLTIGTITLSSDERFEVAHTEESNDWNLMISNLSTSDTGAYECQISSVDKGLRKEVYLNVKDEFSYPEPKITISGTLHVDKGRTLKLMCNASGAMTPPDDIEWFKDGIMIVPDKRKMVELRKSFIFHSRTISSTFSKTQAEMSDTGTYSCRTTDLQTTSVRVQVLKTDKLPEKREPDEQASLTFDISASRISHCPHLYLMMTSSLIYIKLMELMFASVDR
ncbi:hypothetical protein ACF0H5_012650 [Mactra antiquata]